MKNLLLVFALALTMSAAHAASGTLVIEVDAPAYASGQQILRFANDVQQTVAFTAPPVEAFDERCVALGLAWAKASDARRVDLKITAVQYDAAGPVRVQIELAARKPGPTRELLVATTGETARCPSMKAVKNATTVIVGKTDAAILRVMQDDESSLTVRLTAY